MSASKYKNQVPAQIYILNIGMSKNFPVLNITENLLNLAITLQSY